MESLRTDGVPWVKENWRHSHLDSMLFTTKEAQVNNQDKVTRLFRMVSLTCVQSQTGSICQTSAVGAIRLPDRSHRARCKCAPETGV